MGAAAEGAGHTVEATMLAPFELGTIISEILFSPNERENGQTDTKNMPAEAAASEQPTDRVQQELGTRDVPESFTAGIGTASTPTDRLEGEPRVRSPAEDEAEARWADFAASARLGPTSDPGWAALPSGPDPAAAALVLRVGVCPSRRRGLWFQWSGGAALRASAGAGAYAGLCSPPTPDEAEGCLRTINADVARTSPDLPFFAEGGATVLARILLAFQRLFPNPGYVQVRISPP